MNQLNGKTALITGGSRGIGRAICVRLASLGARVVVNYAGNARAAAETVALCAARGGEAAALQADVSDAAQCAALFDQTRVRFGDPDILVCNAGITRDGLLMRMSEEDFDRVLEVNLKGAFHCMKQAARPMARARGGRIIAVSSIVGLRGNAGQVNYAASKAGLIGMALSLAKELASRGVTVNAVAPGYITTDMTAVLSDEATARVLQAIPLGALGEPDDVARAVAFLAGDGARYITGQVLRVDGGMAM